MATGRRCSLLHSAVASLLNLYFLNLRFPPILSPTIFDATLTFFFSSCHLNCTTSEREGRPLLFSMRLQGAAILGGGTGGWVGGTGEKEESCVTSSPSVWNSTRTFTVPKKTDAFAISRGNCCYPVIRTTIYSIKEKCSKHNRILVDNTES